MNHVYCDVQDFYARQMPLMEEGKVEEYIATFTEDGVFEHALGWRLQGRTELAEGIRTGLARYEGKAIRHWYNRFTVTEREDAAYEVSYLAMVSVVDGQGQVSFEPSCIVRDVLVREDGRWLTRSRFIQHDTANMSQVWEGQLAE